MLSDEDIKRIAVALADELERRELVRKRSVLDEYQTLSAKTVHHYHHPAQPSWAPPGTPGDWQGR